MIRPGQLFAIILIFLFTFPVTGQNFWKKTEEKNLRNATGPRVIVPEKYLVYSFEFEAFQRFLSNRNQGDRIQTFDFIIPMPDGNAVTCRMSDTPFFDEELSRKYVGFYSFTGTSVSRPGYRVKMSVSPFYINLMMHDPATGYSYIDPYTFQNQSEYIVYYRKDYTRKRYSYSCSVKGDGMSDTSYDQYGHEIKTGSNRAAGDCQLRSYRLALACTGEYSSFHGGTKEKVLAAYNASMTRVNGVYEADLAITMKLIADTDKLIYLTASSDPYTNNDGGIMLDQNQNNIDNVIGFNNYDIGHVFSTGGGGIAQLRAPCSISKAMGVTGQPQPIGDYFDIDYVAHEMGHQFGANHTQNNSCQRNGPTAIEPGSASTIMGYAGICDPNVQDHSDGYFHGISIGEIANFVVAGNGNSCAVRTQIDNGKPEASVSSANYTIPVSTSFALTAIATDPDGDALSYCWEQVDNETATMPPKANNTAGPAFRSLSPSSSPVRYFPDLQRRYTQWEVLPSVTRPLDFRCTVRDNDIAGGCTDEVNTRVNVTTQAGPFTVTNPNTTLVSWLVGSTQTVMWDVAKTNQAPVNCARVNIFLSTDGGITYPVKLAENVDNTGQYDVVTPSLPTTKAKVMVVAADNIFFDVSNANFKIISSFTLATDVASAEICDEAELDVSVSVQKILDITQPVQMSLAQVPAGMTYAFSENPLNVIPAGTVLSLSNLQNVAPGKYTLLIEASSGVEKISIPFDLYILLESNQGVQPLLPANLASDINASSVDVVWAEVAGARNYTVEVSNNPGFSTLVSSTVTEGTTINLSLSENKVYYWRVRANTKCIQTDFGPSFSFRTSGSPLGQVIFLKNDALLLDAGATAVVRDSMLKVEGESPEFINYTMTGLPMLGFMSLDGQPIAVGQIFTQTAINEGKLSFTHTSSSKDDTDSFTFSVIDGQNRWSPLEKFNIKIRQPGIGVAAYGSTRLTCFGDKNATIEAVGYGGEPPYSYSLDGQNYQNSGTFTGLGAGIYSVYIKDNLQTTSVSNTINITSPDSIALSVALVGYDISAAATGGTGQLNYSIDGQVFGVEDLFKDPGNGGYNVYVRDQNGCTVSQPISINIPQLTLQAQITNDILCFGQKATITCSGSGGIPPYTYSADTTYVSNPVLQVPAGSYQIKIKDAAGKIIASDSVHTTNPNQIITGFTQDKLKITVNASGGTGPIEYSLTGIEYSQNNMFVFPDNGTFRIYVRDANLCVKTINISLNVLKDVTLTARNITCFGKKDGYIKIQALNGTFPFQYSLNGGAFSSTKEWSGLAAGNYEYKVKDNKNDTLTGNVTLVQPDSLFVDWMAAGDDLTVNAVGGTPPYQYSIDGGTTYLGTNIFDDLPPGAYNLAVKDKSGCTASSSATITATNEEGAIKGMSIWPNPFYEKLYLYTDLAVDLEVTLYDLQGRVVRPLPCKEKPCLWELSDLEAGVYIVKITGGQISDRKVVVKY